MIFKGLIVLTALLSAASAQAVATLKLQPAVVDVGTANVVVTCDAVGFTSVLGIVIEKEVQPDEWTVLARISAGDAKAQVVYPHITATGSISPVAGKGSNLQVTVPASLAVGKYHCTALGPNNVAVNVESEVKPGSGGGGGGECCSAIEGLKRKISTLEQTIAGGSWGVNVNWDSSALASIDGVALFELLHWPMGMYSLLMPDTGCPHEGFSFRDWKSDGFRTFHTESTSPENKDEVSIGCHLKQPIQTQNGGNHFINWNFCTDYGYAIKGPVWPNGTYCLLKYSACPPNFHEGYIYWDDENTGNKNTYGGYIPTASFGVDSILYFCCRRDGSADSAVILPNAKPFYLFRFGGKCQKVAGTRVINEYIVFDTDDSANNQDKYYTDYHPDGTLNNIRIELCYYERGI